MDAIRELLLRIKLSDEGKKQLDDVKKDLKDIGKTPINVPFGPGLNKAAQDLNRTTTGAKEAKTAIEETEKKTSLLGSAFSRIGSIGSSAFNGVKSTLGGINEHINKIIGGSGLAAGALFKIAEGMEKNKNSIANIKGDKVAESWQKWADSTSNVGKSLEVAATAAKLLPNRMKLETQQNLAQNLTKFGKVQGIDPSELMEMVGRGNVMYFEQYAKNLGLNIARMQEQTQGMNIEQKSMYLAKLLNKQATTYKGFAGGTSTLKDLEVQTTATERFSSQMTKLSQVMAEGILPTMSFWTDLLTKGVSVLNKYPGVLGIVGSLLGGVFVASSLTKMVTNVTGGIQALWAFAKAEEGVGIAGKMAFLGNPVFLALAAIAAILVYVAYRTGYLQKALEALQNIDLGKLWDNFNKGVDTAFAAIDNLFGKGKLQTAFTIGLSFATGPLIGIWTILKVVWKTIENIANGMSPIEAFLSAIRDGIKSLYDVFKPAIDIFTNIHKAIAGFWSWATSAVPGAQKQQEWVKLDKMLNKIPGLAKGDTVVPMGGNIYQIRHADGSTNTGSLQDLMPYFKTKEGIARGSQIQAQEAKWEKLPGFAEGIATAVSKAITTALNGLGNTLAEALKGAIHDAFGGQALDGAIKTLSDAISGLSNWLQNNMPSWMKGSSGSQSGVYAGDEYDFMWNKEKGTLRSRAKGATEWGKEEAGELPPGVYFDKAATDLEYPKAAGGAKIRGKGLLYGHEDEEVSPANVVKGAKTVLEQLTDKIGSYNPFANQAAGFQMRDINVKVEVASINSGVELNGLGKKLAKDIAWELQYPIQSACGTQMRHRRI